MLQIFQNHQIFSNQEICVISTPTFKLFFMGKLSKHQTINDIKFSVAHWCTTFESEWDFYLNSVSFHMTSEDLVYTFSVSLPLQKKRNTQMSLFSGERNYNFIAQNVFIHVNTVSNESWISKHHKTKKKKKTTNKPFRYPAPDIYILFMRHFFSYYYFWLQHKAKWKYVYNIFPCTQM